MQIPRRETDIRVSCLQGLARMQSLKSSCSPKMSNQNLDPSSHYPLSQKTKSSIKKSQQTFGKQLMKTKEYLAQFQHKLQHVHYLEQLRGQLKQRKHINILKELEDQKHSNQSAIAKIKESSKKNLKGIIEENFKLQQLVNNFQSIRNKQQHQLQSLTSQIQALNENNQQVKRKIKSYFKEIGSNNVNSITQGNDQKGNQKSQLTQTTQISVQKGVNKNLSQKSSLYITSHGTPGDGVNRMKVSPSLKRKKPMLDQNIYLGNSHMVKKESYKRCYPLKNNLTFKSKSMQEYETGIKQIEELEMSIASSGWKSVEYGNRGAASEQIIRKQKLKQRVRDAECKLQVMKLFITYLKGNERIENKTGLASLCKVISYFQKIVKHKEEVLKQVNCMSKNLQF